MLAVLITRIFSKYFYHNGNESYGSSKFDKPCFARGAAAKVVATYRSGALVSGNEAAMVMGAGATVWAGPCVAEKKTCKARPR